MQRRLVGMLASLVTVVSSSCLTYTAWTRHGGADRPYSSDASAKTFLAVNLAGGIALGAGANLAADFAGHDDVPLERQVAGSVIGGPLVVTAVDALVALTIVVFSSPARVKHYP